MKHRLTVEDAETNIFEHEFVTRIAGSHGKDGSKMIDAIMHLSKTNNEPLNITNEHTQAYYRVTVDGSIKYEGPSFVLAMDSYNNH